MGVMTQNMKPEAIPQLSCTDGTELGGINHHRVSPQHHVWGHQPQQGQPLPRLTVFPQHQPLHHTQTSAPALAVPPQHLHPFGKMRGSPGMGNQQVLSQWNSIPSSFVVLSLQHSTSTCPQIGCSPPYLCPPKTSANSQPKELLILLQEKARQARRAHHHPLPRAADFGPTRLLVKHRALATTLQTSALPTAS